MVAALARAAHAGEELFREALEQVAVAAYRTDADGIVTHFNQACIQLAGREPVARQDRWCVTWKLYNEDGTFLPHDQCPMAVALRERRPIRGLRAIAERPDGHRVRFMPFPTPLLDGENRTIGGINLLIDLSDPEHLAACVEQAARCRRLALGIDDKEVAQALLDLAAEFESQLPQTLNS